MGLPRESLAERLVLNTFVEHLDGHEAVERYVLRQIDGAHAARAKLPADLIGTDGRWDLSHPSAECAPAAGNSEGVVESEDRCPFVLETMADQRKQHVSLYQILFCEVELEADAAEKEVYVPALNDVGV